VRDVLPHSADFHLAQNCLEGHPGALELFLSGFRRPLLLFLSRSGAKEDEARELVDELWTECVTTQGEKPPKLQLYRGNCSLQTWLNTVALNKFITRKRHEERWARLCPARMGVDFDEEREGGEWSPLEAWQERSEAPLLELMREALESAFLSCPPERFVLLQLAHCDGLKLHELKPLFGGSISRLSRELDRAAEEIAAATLAHIRANDPWLDLKWSDFRELCRHASPAFFGSE